MLKLIKTSLVMLGLFTALTGILYPLAVTGLAQGLFPAQANGSLITRDGAVVGSALIGQEFTDPAYFWGRPSAAGGHAYNPMSSGGSNLSASNPAYAQLVQDRLRTLQAADPGNTAPVPADLLTASASGLDPDISPAAAYYQIERVARARGRAPQEIRALVEAHITPPTFGFLGEARVNVLAINLALDSLQ